MKNFRKVLALVLVVATLLSFATMASANYKDQASIDAKYSDAVDILTLLGIIAGDDTGNFRPADEIDRDEVAKMVAVLCNGGEDIEAYYADACTFADTKNTWAAGYVAYCYHTGIIDGRNATTFDPNASITGYEVAKMLLCVLGFDADEQGYVGKDWKTNVLRDARNFGLLDGLDKSFNLKNNIKRQEVAQMMLTMLEKPVVVGVLSDNIVKVTNALYTNLGISIKDLGVADSKYAVLYGNVIVSNDTLQEVYGYGKSVVVDCYGRPYTVWTGTNKLTATTKTITRAIAKGAAYASTLVADTHVFINGQYIDTFTKGDDTTKAQTGDVNSKTWASLGLGRKGLVVETYYTVEGTVIAAFETDVARVVETAKWQGVQMFDVVFADGTDTTTQWLKNTEGYAVDDILYTTYCNAHDDAHDELLTLAKAKTARYTAGCYFEKATAQKVKVTDVVSKNANIGSWSQADTTFYAGSTAYNYHEANIAGYYSNGSFDTDAYIAAVGGTYAVYMNNGYVIAWADWTDVDNTVYEYAYFEGGNDWYALDDNKLTASGKTYTWYLNDMIDFSAQEHDDVKTTEATAKGLEDHATYGLLAQYKVVDGKLVLTDGAIRVTGTANIDLVRGEIGIYDMTDSTKVLVKIGSKYEAFTGYKALAAKYGNVLTTDTNNIQIFKDGTKVTYLFIDADKAYEEGYFFILDHELSRTSDQLPGGTLTHVEQYSAVINGEKVKLWIDTDNFEIGGQSDKEALTKKLFEIKTIYLGITVDGEQVYYVADEADLDMSQVYTFGEIDGDKLFWYASVDNLDAGIEEDPFHLASGVEIAVVDYDAKGNYAGTTVYASAAAFNAEWTDNEGYVVSFYTDVADPANEFVNYLFIVREAK